MHEGPRTSWRAPTDDRLSTYGFEDHGDDRSSAGSPMGNGSDAGTGNTRTRWRLTASNPDPTRGAQGSDRKVFRLHSGKERLARSAPGGGAGTLPYVVGDLERAERRGVSVANVHSSVQENDEDGLSDDLDDDDDCYDPPKTEISTRVYLKACSSLRITPVAFFSRHLEKQELVMRRHLLGPKGAKACAIALVLNTTVQKLDLSGTDIRDKGVEYLSQMLTENLYISSLTLADNGLTTSGLRVLCGVLKINRTVRQLDISGNHFGENDAHYVADLIKTNTTLQEFYLRHNGFRELGGEVLALALAKNQKLKVLDLSWNHLRLKGAVAISEAMERNSGLSVLRIAWNGWYLDGCKALGKALAANKTLQELDLTCNRINKDCLVALLNNLKKNTALERLSLDRNPITADGARTLISAIKECPSMAINYINIASQIVDQVFVESLDELREDSERPLLEVTHGRVFRHDDITQDDDALLNEDPMMVLMEFMRQRNMRLVDLFTSLDTDGSKSLTRDEFKDGLMSVNIPMSAGAFDKLMKKLDQDGDGEVDFGELMEGQREYKRKLMRLQKKQSSDPEEESELQRITNKIQRILAAKKADEKKTAMAKIKAAATAMMAISNNVGKNGSRGSVAAVGALGGAGGGGGRASGERPSLAGGTIADVALAAKVATLPDLPATSS